MVTVTFIILHECRAYVSGLCVITNTNTCSSCAVVQLTNECPNDGHIHYPPASMASHIEATIKS